MASGCRVGRQRDSFRLTYVLSSAVLEWLLMFLLFLHALYSFLVTKFARLCKLQTPCLLCSRLDHILGNEKPGFYRDLICNSHKSEISSLAYCHVHRKLADVNEMCEGCLVSFATEKKSNPETYRSLVGKLGVDFDEGVDGDCFDSKLNGEAEVPILKKDPVYGSLITNYCSCCSVAFRKKSHSVKLRKDDSIVRVDSGDFDMSLSNSIAQSHLNHQDSLIKKTENFLGSPSTHHLGNHRFYCLSRAGYSEVKVTSDCKSENPFSDDGDGNHLTEGLKEDLADRCLNPEPATVIPDIFSMPLSEDTAIEKLIQPASSEPEASLSIPEDQLLHVSEACDVSLASTVAVGHDLEEINWNKFEASMTPPAPETISQKDLSEFSDVKLNGSENCTAFASTTSNDEHSKHLTFSDADLVTSQVTSDPVPSGTVHMDLNDAYKIAIDSKGSLTSPTVTEVITGRDSSKVYEDLRLLISQFSAARGLESPWNELSPSPRVQGQGDDSKFSDASSSAILQNITRSLSIERNESGFESLDGSIVSEIEGESPVDRLKRQVELDRKSMYLLYKELEEERSASAIATNQAMAMITRLQEEKAAMQMEALQYQRMMEEQSEYDQEALQNLNVLLAQREKEIQNFEDEVESYREQFDDKLVANNVVGASGDSQATEYDTAGVIHKKKSTVSNKFEQSKSDISGNPLFGLEEEKAYISDCLKKLEKKLHLFSNNGMHVDISTAGIEGEHIDKTYSDGLLKPAVATGSNDLEEPQWDIPEDGLLGGETLSEEDLSLYLEDSSAKKSSSLSPEGHTEANHREKILASNSVNGNHHSMDGRTSDLASLLSEVSQLNERLKALEADRNFLEHTVNTLRSGNDGVQFIQEIACHLQELRRIGITLREQSVA